MYIVRPVFKIRSFFFYLTHKLFTYQDAHSTNIKLQISAISQIQNCEQVNMSKDFKIYIASHLLYVAS